MTETAKKSLFAESTVASQETAGIVTAFQIAERGPAPWSPTPQVSDLWVCVTDYYGMEQFDNYFSSIGQEFDMEYTKASWISQMTAA